MDSGWAALMGALVGGAATLLGTYSLLRHQFKTRRDADRRSAYLEFLEVCGLAESGITDTMDVVDAWRNDTITSEEMLEALDDHSAQRRELAARLNVVHYRLMLYASPTIIRRAGVVTVALAELIPKMLYLVNPETRDAATAEIDRLTDVIGDATDAYVRACREDLKIPFDE